MRRVPEKMTANARTLRNGQTEAERLLWRRLSPYRPRFTRQLVIGPYIVDLACRSAKLAVEFDGSQHLAAEKYDESRSDYLTRNGWTVVRFWNRDVLDNPDGVATAILLRAAECLGGTHPQPLPAREGRKRKDVRLVRGAERDSFQLIHHPDTAHPHNFTVTGKLEREGALLRCRYSIQGDVKALLWNAEAPGRADELWRHTCCELFAKGEGDEYLEFNFAPSRQWASYRFDRYREGMRDAGIEAGVTIDIDDERLILTAEIDLGAFDARSFGLSTVIETMDGAKSYWAVKHPPGKPDFHHPDCFAIELPAAGGS
jgi:very-short-patch-repair endonuclease